MRARCTFCEQRPPTHFSFEWDAELCDECEEAQKDTRGDTLRAIFPGLFTEEER